MILREGFLNREIKRNEATVVGVCFFSALETDLFFSFNMLGYN